MGRTPQPPVGMHMGTGWQAIFTIGQIVPILAMLGVALRLWRRERSVIVPLFLVGGAFAVFIEPIVDVLGLTWFPRPGQSRLFESFGRPIPVYMVLVYAWYVGGQAFLAFRRLEKGGSARDIWRLYGLFMLADVVVETPGLYMNLYKYYGRQPFDFFRLPLWWPFVNAAMPVVAAIVIWRLLPKLTGWRVLAVVPLLPMVDGAVNGAAAWPLWNALNTRLPSAATWPVGLVTCAMGVFVVWIASLAVPDRVARGAPASAPDLALR